MMTREQLIQNVKAVYEWEKKADNRTHMKETGKLLLPPKSSSIWDFIYEVSEQLPRLSREPDAYSVFDTQITEAIAWPDNEWPGSDEYNVKHKVFTAYTIDDLDNPIDITDENRNGLTILAIYTWAYLLGFVLVHGAGTLPLRMIDTNIQESLEETERLLLKYNTSTVEIYRGLCVKDAFKNEEELFNSMHSVNGMNDLWDVINVLNYKKAGVCWAFDQVGVHYYLYHTKHSIMTCYNNNLVVMIRSTVHSSDIDWLYSALLKLYFLGESEMRLNPGTTIKLEAIKEAHESDDHWQECPGNNTDCILYT
jgi:hypothetical protein